MEYIWRQEGFPLKTFVDDYEGNSVLKKCHFVRSSFVIMIINAASTCHTCGIFLDIGYVAVGHHFMRNISTVLKILNIKKYVTPVCF